MNESSKAPRDDAGWPDDSGVSDELRGAADLHVFKDYAALALEQARRETRRSRYGVGVGAAAAAAVVALLANQTLFDTAPVPPAHSSTTTGPTGSDDTVATTVPDDSATQTAPPTGTGAGTDGLVPLADGVAGQVPDGLVAAFDPRFEPHLTCIEALDGELKHCDVQVDSALTSEPAELSFLGEDGHYRCPGAIAEYVEVTDHEVVDSGTAVVDGHEGKWTQWQLTCDDDSTHQVEQWWFADPGLLLSSEVGLTVEPVARSLRFDAAAALDFTPVMLDAGAAQGDTLTGAVVQEDLNGVVDRTGESRTFRVTSSTQCLTNEASFTTFTLMPCADYLASDRAMESPQIVVSDPDGTVVQIMSIDMA